MFNQKDKNGMLLYFAKLPEEYRLEVIATQTDLARIHRKEMAKDHMADYFYDMLLRAIWKFYRSERAIGRKMSVAQDDIAKISEIKIAQVKRKKMRRNVIRDKFIRANLFDVVKRLHDQEGIGWRKIADYIALHHKTRVSFSYIRQLYLELSGGDS